MPKIERRVDRDEARRQRADDLAALGVPERERIEDRAGAERGDERVDLRDLDQHAVDEADAAPAAQITIRTASGHGTPYLTCRPIARMCHMTMPKPTVRSMRPAIIGDGRGKREQRDDRLVGEDRAEVQIGRERVAAGAARRRRSAGRSGSAGRRPAAGARSLASATGRQVPTASARARWI